MKSAYGYFPITLIFIASNLYPMIFDLLVPLHKVMAY